MRLHNLDKTSIRYYISEDLKKDSALNEHWDRIDNEFFKPWQRYLNEAAITPDQINQIFAAAEKEAVTGGNNSTMLGKIVDKIIPSAFLSKLEKSLPAPDPNAQPDPEFEAKASAAVQQLEAPAETKTGLMAIVKTAVKNPQVQAMVLSLVGGVLGGLVQAASPLIQSIFPGGGTVVVAITGAIVAGGVSIAAAKLQGKPWKEAFKGAIKPALAGAAGAVIGSMAAQFASGAVSMAANAIKGGSTPAAGGPPGGAQGSPEQQKAMADDQAYQDRILNKFPPDKGYTFSARGDSLEVFDATGRKVFTGDIPVKTMDMKTFADLTNNGQMAAPGTSSGSIASDPLAGVTDAGGGSKRGNSGFNSMKQTNPDGTPYSVDQINQAKADLRAGNTTQAARDAAAFDRDFADTGAQIDQSDAAARGIAPKLAKASSRFDSYIPTGKKLSEGQVYLVFNKIVTRNNYLLSEGRLAEGPMDWLKTKAKNLTTKVTADKLNSAWKKAGSPMDSEAVAKVLADAGVNPDVVKKVYTDLKIPAAGAAAPAAMSDAEFGKLLDQLNTKQKKEILTYVQQQLRTA